MSRERPLHRSARSRLGLGIAAVLATAPALNSLPAAAADADTPPGSLVYIKGNNVWIADGDGGHQRQLTTGGTANDPWQSPTQSDNGVVVAHHGGIVYRMNQRGEPLGSFDPPDLVDTIGNRLSGRDLTETAISPDGTKIAYTYFKIWGGQRRWATGFTSATKVTDPDQWGISFYDKPSWVTNHRVVLNAWYRNKAHLYDLGERDIPWFDEGFYTSDRKELSDLEVSRDGAWTVGIRGDVGDQSVIVLRNDGDVLTSATPATPDFDTELCNIGPMDGNLREPTIAPDSSSVAWAEPTGIFRSSDMNCDEHTRVDILLVEGGSDPNWSPAELGETPDAPQSLDVVKKPKITGTAKRGKVLKAHHGTWKPQPSSYGYQWTRDGKAIAGARKATYRVTAKDKGHKIGLVVAATRSGWLTTVTKAAPVRVR